MDESAVNTQPRRQSPSLEVVSDQSQASQLDRAHEAETIERVGSLRLLGLLGILLLVSCTYFNTVSGQFVQDDTPQIVENPMIGEWNYETLKKAFTRDFWANVEPDRARDNIDSVYYRPIFLVALMAGHALARKEASSWHWIAIFLHFLAAALTFLAIDRMLEVTTRETNNARTSMSALATLIFVVHPAQSESVAWISGLVGPLSTIFMLGAFICYLEYRQSARGLAFVGSAVLFLIAALTKEQTLVLPIIVLCCELFAFHRLEPEKRSSRGWIILVALVGVSTMYLASRYAAIGALLGRSRNLNFPDDASLTFSDQLRTTPALLLQYCKLALYPDDLSLMYAFGYVRQLSFMGFWLPLIAMAGIAALSIYGARRSRTLALAVIWVVIPLIPHLNTRAFVSDEIIHDRYLYGSLIGVGLAAALLIWRASTHLLIRSAFAAVLVLALALLTVSQNRQWHTDDSLWRRAAETAPDSRLVHLALGALAEDAHQPETALAEYESILETHPDVIDALNNSAILSGRLGRWTDAVQKFERIVELTPEKAIAHFNLSFAYAVQKRYSEAASEQRLAIDLDPNSARVEEWRLRLAQLEKAIAPSPNSTPGS